MLEALLSTVHLGLLAGWVGAMTYSLVNVQPTLAAFFEGGDDEAHEQLLARLAHGNRWRVVALVAAITASGAALWVVQSYDRSTVRAAQLLLLATAGGVFWYVSWRHWPRRVFALPAERPGMRRRLRLLATAMTALAAATFVLGVVASG
ncbi:MAG: hypothetical protein M3419_11060 [Actinomycetota bacterium]|nr:hypothetical protein [Actinomycetota bacterium]